MQTESQFSLLKSRQFLPLFVTQGIGAFNDNALRNAIAMLITFRLSHEQGFAPETFVQAGTALFVLPYFLFSAISGQLADKFDKAVIARRVKFAEALVMAFGAVALWMDSAWLDLAVLFLAGTLAAFFGPVKYGILPQYLRRDQLVAGNGFLELGTFVTILIGTMFGGWLIGRDSLGGAGPMVLSVSIVALAIAAWATAWWMPAAPGDAALKIDWNVPRQTMKLMSYARERKDVFWSVLGASWFWFLGTALLVQLPIFTSDVLNSNQTTANIFIGLFTVGIGAGSLFTNRLLGAESLRTATVREHDSRGRHTTTHRAMFVLPSGALLIDTPGMRELQIWNSESGLEAAFDDIAGIAVDCRFSDCSHQHEPGCAVAAALEDGRLDAARFESYVALGREMRHVAVKQDERLRMAEKQRWKAIHKAMRHDHKRNP